MQGRLQVALAAALLLAAILVTGRPLLRRARTGAPPKAGTAAPALQLRDTEGNEVSLAALRGRVVAVNFWASWCPPCKQEIPDLARVYAEHRGPCFELLGVAEDSAPEDVVRVARQLGASYPVLLDPGGAVGEAYEVTSYPRTFLIDAAGRIRRVYAGAVERGELEDALVPLLAEAAPSCPRA